MEVKEKQKIRNLTPEQFYDSIDILHKKIKKLNNIIFHYFQDKEIIYTKDFFAIQFIDEKVHDITESIDNEIEDIERFKEIFETWYESKEESEFIDDIFKVEINGRIFLFQYFRFENTDDGVIAGYFIKNTISSRLLLFHIANSDLNKNSKVIMEYFKR